MTDKNEVNAAISKCMTLITNLRKDSKNQHHNYSYASIEQFLKECRGQIADCGLHVHIDCHSVDQFTAAKGAMWANYFFKVSMRHSSGQQTDPAGIQITMPLSGAQTAGSAQSYAVKQYLRGVFMIATSDEPEADSLETFEDGIQIVDEKAQWQQWAASCEAHVQTLTSQAALMAWSHENEESLHTLAGVDQAAHASLEQAWTARMEKLKDG